MKNTRFLSILLCISMILPMLMPNITFAEAGNATDANNAAYPYTVYAASAEAAAISISADHLCLNGSLAARGTITLDNASSNINGTVTEYSGQGMVYLQNKLNTAYFSGEVENHETNCIFTDRNFDTALTADGNVTASGALCLNAPLRAAGTISFAGNCLNANNTCLYSQEGDIQISSDNVSLSGLIYAPLGTVCFTSKNINLNGVIIIAQRVVIDAEHININYSADMAAFIGSAPAEEYAVYTYGLYDAEKNSITIKWFTNCLSGSAEILESDDNMSYHTVSTTAASNVGIYDYPVSQEFDLKYFKVAIHMVDGKTIESLPFIMSRTENGYVCEFIDTDGDGLTDLYELYLGTDPLEYTAIPEKKSEILLDSDSDGLYDEEEELLGTDPHLADTDGNGIMDDAEIFAQTVPASDASLSDVNTEQNAYTLSIALSASGYAPRQLSVSESIYAQTLASNALVGTVVDIQYDSAHELQNCTLHFTIKDEYTENVNGTYANYSDEYRGIKRFLVFCYDENIHMLLPIETAYDIENNTVSCEAASLGTYCLIDTELWLNEIGFQLPAVQTRRASAVRQTTVADASDSTAAQIKSEMETAFFNGHTYGIYSGDQVLSWTDAEALCQTLGGHLVSINSQEEQDFIYRLANTGYAVKGLYWLGAYRNENNLRWYWSDGTAFSYTNWSEGEPNYQVNREYYVHMYQTSGKWNDTLNYLGGNGYFSTSNCGLICEWDYIEATQIYPILLGNNWQLVPLDAELSPDQTHDTDMDGLTDWEEVDSESPLISYDHGTPIFPTIQTLRTLGFAFEFPTNKLNAFDGLELFLNNLEFVPCLSNPADSDTDGDGLLDSADPEPLAVFDDRFYITDSFDKIPTIDFVERHIARGQECWASKYPSIWSLPATISLSDVAILGATTSALPALAVRDDIEDYSAMITPDFSRLLLYYLSCEGDTFELTRAEMYGIIFGQKSNTEHYWYNINQLMDAAEEIVMPDSTSDERLYISTTSGNNFKCTCYKRNNCRNHQGGFDDSMAANWGYAIGEALCAMTAEVYVSNGKYCMNVKYYLIDTYEFPVHWDTQDEDDTIATLAHTLHEQGKAKEYRIIGVYDTFVTWSKGESANGDYVDISINTTAYDAGPIS